MSQEIARFNAIGHLPGGSCTVIWNIGDLCTWCVVDSDTLMAPLPDRILPLYAALRDRSLQLAGQNIGSRLKIILYSEDDCFELLPVWKDGILSCFERRDIATEMVERIIKSGCNSSSTYSSGDDSHVGKEL